MSDVRVRFAPSPTGALHIGGVRTALYNYLFAKKHGGKFIIRIEDTDQARFVHGAQEYILEALKWSGINHDEGIDVGGEFGPYKQSERKAIYKEYADFLLEKGYAYYAFDTSEELDAMRERLKAAKVDNQQYNAITRMQMSNALTLSPEEVQEKMDAGVPYVIRLKVPAKEEIRLDDMVRGWVKIHSSAIDDKVLVKSDGMPTYHLASVVDDHLMKISHVIRGEEWLPSAPLHVLLYRYLGWEDEMPRFAHLPLLLKPDGKGKLSKRAADQLGFPVFPLNWTDPLTQEVSEGFREKGYLPEALMNFLALLGWNPGTEQEFFNLEELAEAFDVAQISKGGAKFDIEKAKWFNQHYIKVKSGFDLSSDVIQVAHEHGHTCTAEKGTVIADLMKERITFVSEFWTAGSFFFEAPKTYDEKVVKKKWTLEANECLSAFADSIPTISPYEPDAIKAKLEEVLEQKGVGLGRVMQALRVALTGAAGGPDLMPIISVLGPTETVDRLQSALTELESRIKVPDNG